MAWGSFVSCLFLVDLGRRKTRSAGLGIHSPSLGIRPRSLGNRSPSVGVCRRSLGNQSPRVGNRPGSSGNHSPSLGIGSGGLGICPRSLGNRPGGLGIGSGASRNSGQWHGTGPEDRRTGHGGTRFCSGSIRKESVREPEVSGASPEFAGRCRSGWRGSPGWLCPRACSCPKCRRACRTRKSASRNRLA